MLRQPSFFCSGSLSIQFFNLDTLVSDLRDAMSRQRSLTRTHMRLTGRHATPEVTLHIPHPPTCDFPGSLTGRNATPEVTDRILREAEHFPRGDKHIKNVPPPTYLICLSPKSL